VYSKPSPDVITGTTIESTVYNTFVGDVETDLNLPRPVSSGGTGATSPDGALVNVSGEKAAQLVTSYDTHLWMPGSFRSAAAAAGAPNATSSFVGTAYINEALANPPTNQNVVLEARDQNDTGYVPGRTYVREKKAGVWSAWTGGIYAAPFDALAYNGMQVNGSMEVSQEIGGAGRTTTGYIADGWGVSFSLALNGRLFAGAQAAPIASGISNNLVLAVVTGTPTLAANDYAQLYQNIEGYRIERLAWGTSNAVPITVCFWSAHKRVGTYSSAGDRSYAATYTQVISGLPEYKIVTIPGCQTGIWLATNGMGLSISFTAASGATYTAPSANTWVNGSFLAAPGQVNGVAATTDETHITGVVVLPGTQAPTAAQSPLIMRPYDQELVTCKRYFYVLGEGTFTTNTLGTGHYFSAAQLNLPVQHPVQMRAAPTLGVTGGASFFSVSRNGGSEVFNSFASSALSPTSALIYSGGMAGTAGQAGWVFCNNAAAKVSFDARL
jgi:hypothetical protein